eukprot:scaffold1136_cov146-Cylindrotheca_fusiformis.AAC.25
MDIELKTQFWEGGTTYCKDVSYMVHIQGELEQPIQLYQTSLHEPRPIGGDGIGIVFISSFQGKRINTQLASLLPDYPRLSIKKLEGNAHSEWKNGSEAVRETTKI